MRLIELDAALEGLENLNVASFYEENEHSKEAYLETKDMLKALPTVDTIPVVHGQWHVNRLNDAYWDCTVCKRTTRIPKYIEGMLYAYCPHCGAKMDGKNGDGNK